MKQDLNKSINLNQRYAIFEIGLLAYIFNPRFDRKMSEDDWAIKYPVQHKLFISIC